MADEKMDAGLGKNEAMIKELRKFHVQIWLVLGVLLPAGLLSAWFVIPERPITALIQPLPTQELPVVYQSLPGRVRTISIRTNADHTQWQLQWHEEKIPVTPSAIIYRLKTGSGNVAEGDLIGRIAGPGDYYFPMKSDSGKAVSFLLYDIIHHRPIDRINFQP